MDSASLCRCQKHRNKEFFTEILPYSTPTESAIIQSAESGQQIYSAETYLGFHILLLKLLTEFFKALQQLSESQHSRLSKSQTPEYRKERLTLVVKWGYALQKLAQGAVLHMHLKNIEPMLP
jgi:hypothetical protein